MHPYPLLIVASEAGTTYAARACDYRQYIAVLDELFGKGFHAHCTDFMQQLERGERVDDCVGDGCELVIYPRADYLPISFDESETRQT